jgi:hypothetical protein
VASYAALPALAVLPACPGITDAGVGRVKKYDKNYHGACRIEICGGLKLCSDQISDKQFEKMRKGEQGYV